jgi:hypothetical protein
MEKTQPEWENPTPPPPTNIKRGKVVFARRAADAQHVGEVVLPSPIGQPTQQTQLDGDPETGSSTPKKIGILKPWGKAGRPKTRKPQLSLPPGFKSLRKGKVVWSPEVGEQFIEAYYETGGSLTRACRKTYVQYSTALQWKDTIPEFDSALKEVDQIIKDEIHSQFMERVLNTWEPNPAWKFKYFNKNFPEYSEGKKSINIAFDLRDTLIKPEVIEADVIKPKQLEAGDETGPEHALEAPADPGKVPQSSE